MTGKEIVNLIRQLREAGMSDTKILDLIEYIETHAHGVGQHEGCLQAQYVQQHKIKVQSLY